MNFLTYLLLFQVAVFTLYTGFIVRSYGLIDSYSYSWYLMGDKQKKLFTFFIWSLAVPMFIIGGITGNWCYAASGVFLAFVGGAAAYKERVTGVVHYIGASGGIAFALVGIAADGSIWPLIAIIVLAALCRLFKLDNRTWWVEYSAFLVYAIGFTQTNL